VSGGFIIEPLGAHERSSFYCGAEALDRYWRERASQDVKRMLANCFVLRETATGAVAGFYTLSAASVPASDVPTEILKRLPRYPVLPAALMGRLAIDRRFQRRGLASALLADAAKRVLKGDLKAFALIVEAKDESAVAFYRLQGFQPFASRPMSLFLPLETFKRSAVQASLA
jgi:ribosomal protein S18 acetylase RimI-like enzyme